MQTRANQLTPSNPLIQEMQKLVKTARSSAAEYASGGLSNNIIASRYVLYMPDKEQLIAQAETVLKNWHEKNDAKNNGIIYD